MKITNDRVGSVTTHTRNIDIEDGPVVGAGDSYIDGTFFRVDKIRIQWIADNPAETVKLRGYRCTEDGGPVSEHDHQYHDRNIRPKDFPDWLTDFAIQNNLYVVLTDGGHRRR